MGGPLESLEQEGLNEICRLQKAHHVHDSGRGVGRNGWIQKCSGIPGCERPRVGNGAGVRGSGTISSGVGGVQGAGWGDAAALSLTLQFPYGQGEGQENPRRPCSCSLSTRVRDVRVLHGYLLSPPLPACLPPGDPQGSLETWQGSGVKGCELLGLQHDLLGVWPSTSPLHSVKARHSY